MNPWTGEAVLYENKSRIRMQITLDVQNSGDATARVDGPGFKEGDIVSAEVPAGTSRSLSWTVRPDEQITAAGSSGGFQVVGAFQPTSR